MSQKPPLLHTGIVQSYQDGVASVRIYHGGNCGACPAKGGCASASLGEDGQVVDVHYDGPLNVGQKVDVALRARTDLLAMTLAFLVPIILLVGCVIAGSAWGASQAASAFVGIGAVVAYLGVLSLLQKQLHKKFELVIIA